MGDGGDTESGEPRLTRRLLIASAAAAAGCAAGGAVAQTASPTPADGAPPADGQDSLPRTWRKPGDGTSAPGAAPSPPVAPRKWRQVIGSTTPTPGNGQTPSGLVWPGVRAGINVVGEKSRYVLRYQPPFKNKPGVWVQETPLPVARERVRFVEFQGGLFAIGGLERDKEGFYTDVSSTLFKLNSKGARSWESVALPADFQLHDTAACSTGQYLVCAGGLFVAGTTRLKASANAFASRDGKYWYRMPPMTEERAMAAAVAVDGLVYAIGGWNLSRGALKSCERFDPEFAERDPKSVRKWEQMPDLPRPMRNVAAAAIGRTIYAIGGESAPDDYRVYSDVYALNVDDQKSGWRTVASLPIPRQSATALSLGDGIRLFGGSSQFGETGGVGQEVFEF